jgi:hypothetical protein
MENLFSRRREKGSAIDGAPSLEDIGGASTSARRIEVSELEKRAQYEIHP